MVNSNQIYSIVARDIYLRKEVTQRCFDRISLNGFDWYFGISSRRLVSSNPRESSLRRIVRHSPERPETVERASLLTDHHVHCAMSWAPEILVEKRREVRRWNAARRGDWTFLRGSTSTVGILRSDDERWRRLSSCVSRCAREERSSDRCDAGRAVPIAVRVADRLPSRTRASLRTATRTSIERSVQTNEPSRSRLLSSRCCMSTVDR